MDYGMPRTLIVDLAVGYGGSSSRVLKLIETFPEGAAALVGLDNGAITVRAQEMGLPVYTMGRNKADPRIAGRIASVIRDEGWQVVDTQNIQSKVWGSQAAGSADAALVSTLNSWYEDEHGGNLKGRIYQGIELATNRNIDLYITVSTQDKARLLERGIEEDAISLIFNAVDLNPEDYHDEPAWLRQEYGLPSDAIVCAAAGRLVWQKGYPDLVDAFALIRDEIPNLYCLVMGEGDMRDEITEQIAKHGLQERIRLLGYTDREKLLSVVRSSDFFVMPSRYEGTPVALLEAAALAKPIVAAKGGGIPDLVNHEEHALLSEVEDPRGLAENLRRITSEPQTCEQLAANAQQRVHERFSPAAQAEATRQAYQKAWERSRERLGQ